MAMSDEKYAGLAKNDWLTIHSVALTVIICSMMGSSYIIFRTLKSVWSSRSRAQFPVVGVLPCFLAIADFCFGTIHGLDHILSLSQSHVTVGDACIAIGVITNIFIIAPAFISGYIAFFIWSVVVKEKTPTVGRYYWRTLLWCFGAPIALGLLQLAVGEIGQEKGWCGNRTYTGMLLFQTVELLINIVVSSYLYWSIQRKLRKHLDEVLTGDTKEARKLQATIRRLPAFILVFIVQFTPWVVYTFASSAGDAPVAVIVVVVAIVNGGGIANAFAFRQLLETAERANREEAKSYDAVRSRSGPASGVAGQSTLSTAISLEPVPIY
ncbi:MAG: hypothetical protein MHM6MM_002796 [Cercozoa sp. M6MM]